MKVKCINIYNEHTKKYVLKDPWMTIGRKYLALEIIIRKNEISYVVISDSNQQPVIQNAIQFEIINGNIPRNWQVTSDEIELLRIGPKSWQGQGFWENCYDHEPHAIEIYKREARIIMEEEDALGNKLKGE